MKNALLLFLIILCSCIKTIPSNEIIKVTLHGKSLYGFRRFEMDSAAIKVYDDDYAAHISPEFIYELDDILSRRNTIPYDSLSNSYIRTYYKVKRNNGRLQYIFMNLGANQIIYKNKLFRVDSSVALTIIKYLPEKSDYRHEYDKASHTPSILIKRHYRR